MKTKFEEFIQESVGEAPTLKKIGKQNSTGDKCPNCGSTQAKHNKWFKDARICKNCETIWDINFPEKYKKPE